MDWGYEWSYADPSVWMKDMEDHYEYICVWVDDVLVLSKNLMAVINKLREKPYEYKLKIIGKPEYYLGTNMKH